MKRTTSSICLAFLCHVLAGSAQAGVSVFQNGVGPSAEYAGCKDTWISSEKGEVGRMYGASPTITLGGTGRAALIRFDLSAIPKDNIIHKAVLRLVSTGVPRADKDGRFPAALAAFPATHEWDDTASWVEFKATPVNVDDKGKRDPDWKPLNTWKTPGGDFSEDAGMTAKDARFDTGIGHVFELDVTAIVKAWQEGKLPNLGFVLQGLARQDNFASSEWYALAARPALLVDNGAKGSEPSPAAAMALKPAPRDIPLDEVAATADGGGTKGDYATVCVGQNANCALRGASTDTYIKDASLRFPGTWGWYDMIRVGGKTGDVSHALLYFDLAGVAKDASVKEAKLVLSLTPYTNGQVTLYRYGAYLVKLPESPGWSADEATLTEAKGGKPWPQGGVVAASSEKPLAIGKVISRPPVGGKGPAVPTAVEFDLTGAVRAWLAGKVPNCGIVIDGRIEGGAFDFWSSRALKPELRPYLQLSISPGIDKKPEPIITKAELPSGDYWVEPMRKLHMSFKGTAGVLTQYGDSITVTQAFLEPHYYQKTVTAEKIAPEVQKEMDVVTAHANRKLWKDWKGSQWGCTGMKTSTWFLDIVDGCQERMKPECCVILFGTNDWGGICPPDYTENMAAAIRRIMRDGCVPMLTTVPPANGRDAFFGDYYAAHVFMANYLKVPMIDYFGETLKRRPTDWNGALPQFKENYAARKAAKDPATAPAVISTIISTDGGHPSFPGKWAMDWSEEGLSNSGYTLRNYMTLRMYSQVISKVFLDGKEEPATRPK